MHLYQAKTHKNYTLSNCPEDQLLSAMGVRNGLEVHVVTRQPLGGPVVIRIKKREIAIDKSLACLIFAQAVK